MTRAKQVGTAFETDAVNYLKEHGFPNVYRPATAGAKDSGDINGIKSVRIRTPGQVLPDTRQAIIQCKREKKFDLSGSLNDAVSQATQDAVGGDALPILLQKRPGVGVKSFGRTYAVLQFEDLVQLLKDAGYS